MKAPKAAKPLPKALSVDDSVQLASYQNADTMQLTAQLDESRLLNERLNEKFNGLVSDFNKHKEKTRRQLSFMVTENDQLKKDSTAQSDRYYDEKKKLQASLRSLESELAKTVRRGNLFHNLSDLSCILLPLP